MARKERAADTLLDTRQEVAEARTRIQQTLASLDRLVSASPPELTTAYREYAKNVDAMRAEATEMERLANQMRERSTHYLAEWQRAQMEVQDPQLRELSQQRRELVANNFSRVSSSFQTARQTFDPFLTDLEDIRKVAGNDLTPQGIASIKNTEVVRTARTHGGQAASQLDVAIAEFDKLSATLEPPAAK
jgi:hypothetical protein